MLLCCGDALIDMIPSPCGSGNGHGFVPHAGGAVFNTAITLGRLGVRVGMLTGLSSDMFGQQLAEGLRANHVDAGQVIYADRPSTLAFVELTGGHATYSFFDENSAGRMIARSDLPQPTDEITALFFGGISLAIEPCADTYAGFLAEAGGSRSVMLDPNIRPDFIRDPARYRARLTEMLLRADIVKVSDEDLNWIYPGAESLTDKIAMLRAAGPSVVVVTRGGEGATAFLRDGNEVTVGVEPVEVVDTIGAGDTFNGGFLASLSEQGMLTKAALAKLDADTTRTALAFAARVAAFTVSRSGANPPWRMEL